MKEKEALTLSSNKRVPGFLSCRVGYRSAMPQLIASISWEFNGSLFTLSNDNTLSAGNEHSFCRISSAANGD